MKIDNITLKKNQVVKISPIIKTLILEIMAGNGPGHIKEIHLRVIEFRPEVPQHTVRARLSEMARSEDLEEKLSRFGNGFYGLYAENKELCSVYPILTAGHGESPGTGVIVQATWSKTLS